MNGRGTALTGHIRAFAMSPERRLEIALAVKRGLAQHEERQPSPDWTLIERLRTEAQRIEQQLMRFRGSGRRATWNR